MKIKIRIKITITIIIANGIQSGDNTHHQDQLITFNNFKAINTIPKTPGTPILLTIDLILILNIFSSLVCFLIISR